MTSPLSKRPIVIVEDSNEDYEVTVWALREAEITNSLYRCATSAEVDTLLRNPSGGPDALGGSCPLLVLLDINLPGADRHDTLQRLRNHPWWKRVPV